MALSRARTCRRATFRSKLVPNAVRWYTGEANEDDEDDEDDEYDDEDGDDEDDDDDDEDDEVSSCQVSIASLIRLTGKRGADGLTAAVT